MLSADVFFLCVVFLVFFLSQSSCQLFIQVFIVILSEYNHTSSIFVMARCRASGLVETKQSFLLLIRPSICYQQQAARTLGAPDPADPHSLGKLTIQQHTWHLWCANSILLWNNSHFLCVLMSPALIAVSFIANVHFATALSPHACQSSKNWLQASQFLVRFKATTFWQARVGHNVLFNGVDNVPSWCIVILSTGNIWCFYLTYG